MGDWDEWLSESGYCTRKVPSRDTVPNPSSTRQRVNSATHNILSLTLFVVAHFGLRGEAPTVFLAQPEGLGIRSPNHFEGPKVRPLARLMRLVINYRAFSPPSSQKPVYPALLAGLGKLLGLRPEIQKTAQHQNSRVELVFSQTLSTRRRSDLSLIHI